MGEGGCYADLNVVLSQSPRTVTMASIGWPAMCEVLPPIRSYSAIADGSG